MALPLITPPLTPQPSSPSKIPFSDLSISPTPKPSSTSTFPSTTTFLHAPTPNPKAISAQGLQITLEDGHTILDAVGGAAVASLGMGNPEIIEAITQQVGKMGYAYHQLLRNEPAERLSDFLVGRSNGNFEAAAFLNSGSEAVEACIKLCRQYWVEKGEPQRKYIIARFPSYHGNTLGALAVGNVPSRRDIYSPFISDFIHHVPSPTYKRSHLPSETEEQYSQRLAEELDSKILELGSQNVMAFFAEPVVGAALGVMPPPKGYFPAINFVIQKHGILFVMDEVMSGSGRCGQLFAHQAVGEGVVPDMLSMAKGLGAGYVTISAILVNKKVKEQVVEAGGQWKNSHTYQNHPVNCAAALKVMEIMERDNLLENVRVRGEQMLELLKEGLKDVKEVFDIRGKGLFIGVEFLAPSTMKPRMAARVKEQCLKNGVLVLGLSGIIDGKEGESITIAPAYIVTEDQVREIARIVVQSIKECYATLEK